MKNDQYLRKRGGKAKMIYVNCGSCGERLLYYQKDGPGWLKRCYLNRIFAPDQMEKLQHDISIVNVADLKPLICTCGKLIGTPMCHKDGRLAFRLERGSFIRKTAH